MTRAIAAAAILVLAWVILRRRPVAPPEDEVQPPDPVLSAYLDRIQSAHDAARFRRAYLAGRDASRGDPRVGTFSRN